MNAVIAVANRRRPPSLTFWPQSTLAASPEPAGAGLLGRRNLVQLASRFVAERVDDLGVFQFLCLLGRVGAAPGGEIRLEAMVSTKAEALKRFRAPELMRSTFIRPDEPIRRPRP